MHTPHKLLGRKSKIDYKHAIYGKHKTNNQHPMLYADNFYLLLFYRCRHCLARLFTKGNKKNRLLAKGKKCHVKKCRSRAEFHIGTQMKTLRRHEPSAIRTFSHFQIFRRKMRRASCISTIWWGVTVSCSSSHFLCHFDFNLTAGVGPSC